MSLLSASASRRRPQDFRRCIELNHTPAKNRELRVEILEASHNWNNFLKTLNLEMSGIAITASERSVTHCFRAVSLQDLRNYKGSEAWKIENQATQDNLAAVISFCRNLGRDDLLHCSERCWLSVQLPLVADTLR